MRRLVHFDEAPPLETPLLLLGALREIDPLVELVHFGIANKDLPERLHGMVLQDWRLGAVRPSDVREKVGRAMLERESRRSIKNMRNVLLGRLAVQGFAQIARYLSEGTPGQALTYDDSEGLPVNIVDDFLFRDQQWKLDQGEANFAVRLDESEMGPTKRAGDALLRDKLHTDGRDEFRRGRRGAIITNIWGG